MKKIWVATGNAHKVEEIAAILGSEFEIRSFKDLDDPPHVVENGSTYLENAEIKARALYELVKEPVFADDSGLEVDALNGKPGIHSARYSGDDANHERNIARLLQELGDLPQSERNARFRCVIVYIDDSGKSHSFEGIFSGYIGTEKSGCGGFGYDPVFYLKERNCSVAELSAEEKNRLSHRSIAVEKLKKFLQK